MSAICGFVNLNGQPASYELGTAMLEALKIYPSNYSEKTFRQQLFLGCHHQIDTPESKLEQLPYFDPTSGLTITADAIIDNRLELLREFKLPEIQWPIITDSQLILLAYKKWGTQCPVYLIGDYAFVIWNSSKEELFCARDQVGKRTFYYVYQENLFAFCTVMNPLLLLPTVKKTLNDQWLADFLAINTVSHELTYNHTIYKSISQLEPAHCLVVKPNGLQRQKYWDPLKLPEIRLKTEAEYYSAFREIFSEAVRCRIRSEGSVGIMLSGGLDSGAVACVATGHLKEQNKRLLAYSAIPMEDYNEHLSPGYISDERAYIEVVGEHCGNIEITYCRSEGKNSVTDIDRFIAITEHPYKVVENFFWVDNIIETAARDKCRVLLGGQYGNITISYGDFFTQAFSLLTKCRLISLYKEITAFCRLRRFSRKKFCEIFLKLMTSRLYPISKPNENNLINPALARRYNTNRRLKKIKYGPFSPKICSLSEYRKRILNSPAFSHIGAMETKTSLAHGIAQRDPTRDKRLIEFCFRIPGNLYVSKGLERLLVRRAMEGIMPDKVRLNMNKKGIQSADWLQRLSPMWRDIQDQIMETLLIPKIGTYADINQVIQTLRNNQVLRPGETNATDIRKLLVILILGRYLKTLECEVERM